MDEIPNGSCKNLKRRTNMDIKIVSARLGCAKEELSRDSNCLLRINFIRKNPMKNTEERMKSKKVKLKDSLMYFSEEKINFTDIDHSNDILEVSLSLLSSLNEKEKQFRYSIIRVKDLVCDREKDDIWPLNMQSLVNIKYKVYHDYVKDIMADINFVYKFLDTNNRNSEENDKEKEKEKVKEKSYTNTNIKALNSCADHLPYSAFLGSPKKQHSFNSINNILPITYNNKSKETKKYSIPSSDPSINAMNLSNLNLKDESILRLNKLNNSTLNLNSNSKSIMSNSCSGQTQNFPGEIIDCDIVELNETNTNINNMTTYDTFCEAFFVSGLPLHDAKMLTDWENLKSSCAHKDCSLLPAYRPDVLYKFQKHNIINTSIEINCMTAGLCFPNGIKLCYSSNGSDNTNLQSVKTFTNVITNEKGETFYLLNFFYYKLIDYETFNKIFNFDPVREYLKILTDPNVGRVKIEKELQICSNFILSHYKYIPECISLISKFPYAKQMEKCLESIYKLVMFNDRKDKITQRLNFNPNEELTNLLSHLINEIPVPPMNKKLMFYIPFNLIEIPSSCMKELPILNYHLRSILDNIPIENLILIFNLIILEQKILFIHDDYSKLSEISQSFLAILQPFTWVNTFIPVLSEEIIKYLQSFIPFVMGIDENLLNVACKLKYLEPDENNKIFFINITKKTIGVSTSKKDKKISKKNLLKEGIPELPQEVIDMLTSELKALKKVLDDTKSKSSLNLEKVDNTMREIFMKAMVMLIGDYKKYVTSSEEGYVNFNGDSFLMNRPKIYKKFYQEMIQTQIFKEFLQREKRERSNKSSTNNTINQFSNYTFFNHLCMRHISLINQQVKVKTKRSSSVSHNDLVNTDNTSRRDGHSLSKYNSGDLENGYKTPNITSVKKLASLNDTSILLNTSDLLNSKSEMSYLANENTASNTRDMTDCYLITPYFVNDPICKFDPAKIEEIMAQKFFLIEFIEKEIHKKVLISQFPFNESKRLDKMRRYRINEMSCNNGSSALTQLKTSENETVCFITLPDISKISETVVNSINESLAIIFSQKEQKEVFGKSLTQSQHDTIKKILALRQGRYYLAHSIFVAASRENKTTQNFFSLSINSFNDLSRLIYTFLVFCEDNPSEYKEIRLVTKATFYYYRSDQKTKKINYIYEELIKKQISIWQSEKLWVRWFELEVEEEKDNNVFPNIEDFYFTVLLKLGSYMSQLGLKHCKICHCIIQGIAPTCLNKNKESSSVLIKELQESLDKQSQTSIH